jgi:N-formylglutamate amidohydrolase
VTARPAPDYRQAMQQSSTQVLRDRPSPFALRRPTQQTLPAVFASPHSGVDFPAEFLAAARLDPSSLRRSEDCYVDELFAAAPRLGAPLLSALFPRAFVDANREPLELDPHMFEDPLPPEANTASPRVAAGLGVIARVVATGEEIYGRKLRFAEALARLERYYRPYHAMLGTLIAETKRRFGHCVLVDCHSMPSVGGPTERDAGRERVDVVLGDCRGSSCAAALMDLAEGALRRLGYAVARNDPYSGGFVTQHYGRPGEGVHALQIEINRALYLDEATLARGPGFARIVADMSELVRALGEIARGLGAVAA